MSERLDRRKLYHDRLSACRKCGPYDNIMIAPRLTAGGVSMEPKLVIMGQNPPRDPNRAFNGAWMIHNADKALTNHERLVHDLIRNLCLDHKQVLATQLVKCATVENKRPSGGAIDNCSRHLRDEMVHVWPLAIPVIVFGEVARYHLPGYQMYSDIWESFHVSSKGAYHFDVCGRYVFAPHPSVAGRFIDRDFWLGAVHAAYLHARENCCHVAAGYTFAEDNALSLQRMVVKLLAGNIDGNCTAVYNDSLCDGQLHYDDSTSTPGVVVCESCRAHYRIYMCSYTQSTNLKRIGG